jgi:type III pantothenate kinase
MKLLIDAGNSRIKWALVSGGDWLCKGDLPTMQVDGLPQAVADQLALQTPGTGLHDIQQIWASNVAGEDCAGHIRNVVAGRSVQTHFVVAQKSQCGVRNGYSNPSQLGSDRWAALIAAWHLVQGACLVVNCGTATTIDALSGQGEFVGGLILPGVELMQHSLVDATVQLQSTRGEYARFPLNSADALYSGAMQASCGAIERQYDLLGDDSAIVVLSGGAAKKLQPCLDQKRFSALPRIVDSLVLQGLLLMVEEQSGR